MKKTLQAAAFMLAGVLALSFAGCKDGSANDKDNTVTVRYAGNPIVTSLYTADPSAYVWQTDPDRLYVYPSTDVFPRIGFNTMDQYHVFSTDNMLDWVDHGEILRRDDLPESWGSHYPDAMFMWAPAAAYRTGVENKGPYFFIFPHSTGSSSTWGENWMLGIAWSDSPHKGFKGNSAWITDVNGVPVTNTSGMDLIDPSIFQDGSDYYLVTGGDCSLRIAKFADDMVSLAEEWTIYFPYNATQQVRANAGLNYYFEAPWMFTRNVNGNKVYYLMYAAKGISTNGDNLAYSTSTVGPYGPWEYQGVVLDTVSTKGTNHGSIVEFKGKWYLFYHNADLSKGIDGLRSICVDELFFNPDGTIQKVKQTSTSVTPIGPSSNTAALDSKFGAGNWKIEEKYPEMRTNDNTDFSTFVLDQKYNASLPTVIAGGGALKAFDFSTGVVYNLHLPGTYAEWTQLDGKIGGKAAFKTQYTNGGGDTSMIAVTVNGQVSREGLGLPPSGDWGPSGLSTGPFFLIDMKPGTDNTIRFHGAGANFAVVEIYFEK